jgi:hypothetical protein
MREMEMKITKANMQDIEKLKETGKLTFVISVNK